MVGKDTVSFSTQSSTTLQAIISSSLRFEAVAPVAPADERKGVRCLCGIHGELIPPASKVTVVNAQASVYTFCAVPQTSVITWSHQPVRVHRYSMPAGIC